MNILFCHRFHCFNNTWESIDCMVLIQMVCTQSQQWQSHLHHTHYITLLDLLDYFILVVEMYYLNWVGVFVVHFISIQFNSYVYFRHKKSIYNKIYIQLDKIYIRIYNNAIRSIRTKKVDFKENRFIMLQCRTTNSKCLRRLEPRRHK